MGNSRNSKSSQRLIISSLITSGLVLLVLFKSEPSDNLELPCDSLQVKNSIKQSEVIYEAFKKKRESLVKSQPEKVNPWAPYTYPYDYFLPTFGCPFSVQRVGLLGDGGKWVCGLELLQKKSKCVVYSFGISNETSFELEILQRTSCEIFAFDLSVDEVVGIPEEFKDRIHFTKIFRGAKDTPHFTTLGSAMNRNGHGRVDLLKVDVEGNEFTMLNQIIQQYGKDLPFSQLLMEIHGRITDGLGFARVYKFFETLEGAGLRPFRNELNIAPMIVQDDYTNALCEYSFLNINRFCV